jgi:hypothetical protein
MNKQPKQAVFVRVVKSNEIKVRAEQVQAKIHDKLEKLRLPQGPAFINGRWE